MSLCSSNVSVDPFLCNKCENTLSSFLLVCENSENLFNYLYKHKVLCETKNCPKCNKSMRYDSKLCQFRCSKGVKESRNKQRIQYYRCRVRISQFTGTFFEKHRISIIKICKFVAYWALMPHPRTQILEHELEMSTATVVDWSNYLREMCHSYIYNNTQPLGGVGKTVEIDEAKIDHKKDNKGRIIETNWVFGGVERESKKAFIFPVEKCDKETLLPIIKEHILSGTTIVSKCWKAYNCHQSEGFQYLTLDHSINFVDPETGDDTQMIEKLFREVRLGVPRRGNMKHHLNGFIAEFLFKRQFKEYKERLHHLWIAISKVYKPTI